MVKSLYILIVTVFFTLTVSSQVEQVNYEEALEELSCMLNGSCQLSFKEAVFTVENAYYNKQLNKQQFDKEINRLTSLCKGFIKSRKLTYSEEDIEEVQKYASLFHVMTDTIPIQLDTNIVVYHHPFTYNFHDIWGYADWSSMFVSKLLDTKKGNCHSLPYLYKILAEELQADVHISVAPNHFYIKHKNKKNGWYNTELTSGIFPNDAWIMASGYIHLDAIVNKLYMEALNDKQSIALCVIDLAQGYQRKLGVNASQEFILRCCDTALKYYPNYVNALILQAETKKEQFEIIMKEHKVRYASEMFFHPKAKELFNEMTLLYGNIHTLGYRKMPDNMYLSWLTSLKEERDKYENKKITEIK